jgi:hypothetical protein
MGRDPRDTSQSDRPQGGAATTPDSSGFFGPVDLGMWRAPGWEAVRESTARIAEATHATGSKEGSTPRE